MKKEHKQILRTFWQESKVYPWHLFAMVLGITIGISGQFIVPWLFKLMIDAVEQGTADFNVAFNLLLIGSVASLLLEQGWRISGFAGAKVFPSVQNKLNQTTYHHIFKQSHQFFTDNFSGSLVKKVNRYVDAYQGIAAKILWGFSTQLVRIIIATTGMTIIDWRLGAIFIVWICIYGWANVKYLNYQNQFDSKTAAASSRVTAQLADSITNQENIRYFASLNKEIARLTKVVDTWESAERKAWHVDEIAFAAKTAFMILGEFLLLWLSLHLWDNNVITFGTVIALQSYVIMIMYRLWDLTRELRHFIRNLADAEEMQEIFNITPDITDVPNAQKLKVPRGKVEFKNINFNYKNGTPLFKNFNLKIKAGEKIGLVGLSGAGKTSLIKLILRLYDVTSGEVLIDNQNITAVSQNSLRNNISFVPQDPMMFHRSIKANISYGIQHSASQQEIETAAKQAYCHEFITKTQHGYQTKVGERGIKLSGGERQRLAIARAILKNAPILILDEATSSLDSKSEKLIQKALHNVMEGKTVIAIAHRLSTIQEMDRIIVLENGKIIEEGTHQQLMKNDNKYAELWKIQSGNTTS